MLQQWMLVLQCQHRWWYCQLFWFSVTVPFCRTSDLASLWDGCEAYFFRCIARKAQFSTALQSPSKVRKEGRKEGRKEMVYFTLNTFYLRFVCTIPYTYHGLCYTSCGALAGMKKCVYHKESDQTTHSSVSRRSARVTSHS